MNTEARLKKSRLGCMPEERLVVVLLTDSGRIVSLRTIAKGGKKSVFFYPDKIRELCEKAGVKNFVLAHNHPRREHASPSVGDIVTTKNMILWAKWKGLNLLDHIVATATDMYSMKSNNHLKGDW